MYRYAASEEAKRMIQELKATHMKHNLKQRHMLNKLQPAGYCPTAKPEFNSGETAIDMCSESME